MSTTIKEKILSNFNQLISEIEIEISVEYSFDEKKNEFDAEVSISIPLNERNNLPTILFNEEIVFFYEYLTPFWGNNDSHEEPKFKRKRVTFSSKTIEDLKEKVSSFLKEEINKLKEVKRENEEKRSQVPQKEEMKINI